MLFKLRFTMGMSMVCNYVVPVTRYSHKNHSQLTACSRQIFAFSRDGALPFSRTLYYVSATTHAPIYCVWFAAFMSLLLGLLAFAGASAIGAVFSLVVAGQYVAYSIPISARFLGSNKIKPGPFTLGIFVSSFCCS